MKHQFYFLSSADAIVVFCRCSQRNVLMFGDCRQITFLTLNGFCLLSNPPTPRPHPPPLLLFMKNVKLLEYQAKLNWKIDARFTLPLKSWRCKKLQDIATSSFISCCFKSVFTLADIIFLQLFRASFKIILKKKSQIRLF